MLNPQVFSDLRLIMNWLLYDLFGSLWVLLTTTILAFVVVIWVFGYIIKFFKRILQ